MKLVQTVVLAGYVSAALAAPYTDVTPKYDRVKSRAMVRTIAAPTVANLDYAAYNANPVRHDPQKFKPKPKGDVALAGLTFGGMLEGPVDAIDGTPLTDEEKAQPMAWRPVENKLWELTKEQGWQSIAGRIASEKFGDREVFKPFQEVATVYLHAGKDGDELWARVDFMPWVKFLEGVEDDDGDGFLEIYGRLVLDKVPAEAQQKAFAWIRDDYTRKKLNYEQIRDWINVLASYWYPTMNTDIMEMGEDTLWPTATTEKKCAKAMKGVTVAHPVAVVRGNPFGQPIYNVYVVEGITGGSEDTDGDQVAAADKKLDTSESENAKANVARFAEEVKANGGSYDAWAEKNKAYVEGMKKILAELPEGQMGFKGTEDWVYFRKTLEYLTAGDLADQSKEKNPLPHLVEFQKFLNDQNVNMLFVVVPTKADVYYEHLPAEMPDASDVIINPYGRKFLSEVQAAGIEVIDLLPRLLEAKAQDADSKESLYQHQDTHWTNRGLQIAAELIANRIKEYAWFGELEDQKVAFTVTDTTFMRQGDIVDKLPESERGAYPSLELEAQQVKMPDGSLRKPTSRTAPIMLIGDSFTGVFELVDCKAAGVGSHIAARTEVPVDVITSWGGGPLVRRKMVRARKKDMQHKRLVVYLMVARDLYNYAQSWKPLVVPK